MQAAVGKSPNPKNSHLRKARRRDSLAETRMRQADEAVRDPRKERQAMLRFLAYLTPYTPLFVAATLCGITNYAIGWVVPNVAGYVLDLVSHASRHVGRVNPLYPALDRLLGISRRRRPQWAKWISPCCDGVIFLLCLLRRGHFLRSFLANIGGQRVIFKLRNDLYEHIQSLSLSFFQQNRSGSIVSRLTSDIALAQNFIGNACTLLWMDSLSVVGVVIWLFVLSPRMALVSIIVLPLWVISVRFFGQRIRKASHAVQEGLSELVRSGAGESRRERLWCRLSRGKSAKRACFTGCTAACMTGRSAPFACRH